MRLILVRHGRTVENQRRIVQGHIQGTLSKEGVKQAKLLAKRLSDMKIDIIFTSDLKRAKDTAKEIIKLHPEAKLVEDKRLRERSFGIYDGKHKDIVIKKVFQKNDFSYRPSKGESFEDVIKRVKSFYKEILKNYAKKTVLVVAHGGILVFFTRLVLDKSLKAPIQRSEFQKNTAVTDLKISDKGKVRTLCLNCDKHL
ncbi:MAG: histidine phosphatase family protein [Nanoarchaeota archaeon]|nr:histidine phosphatase family protein [Nanoarchaeota archaeon]